MTTPHPLLVKAAKLVEQARAIQEEYSGDPSKMPADVAEVQDRLLKAASQHRRAVEREAAIEDHTTWLSEPEYKHDMTHGDTVARSFGHGAPLLESERKDRQKAAFFEYLRKGYNAMSMEHKADLVEDATGEALVPTDFAGAVLQDLPREGVIRGLAFVRPTTSNKVDIAPITEGTVAWGKLETGTTLPDSTPVPSADQIEVRDLLGLAKVGEDELEDSAEDLESLFREIITMQFSEKEDDAFANGNPSATPPEPEGIARNVGDVSTVAAASATPTADQLKSLKYRVSARFRRNGVYLAHSGVEEVVSLLKGSDGQYLWQPSLAADEPATFAGKRWYTVDGLPDPSTAGVTDRSVIFGDVRAGYMIADRRRITVKRLDELYAAQGKIGFKFTHRVGGGVIRPAAFAAYLL